MSARLKIKKVVSFQLDGVNVPVEWHHARVAAILAAHGEKIEAIKFIREQYQIGLKDSKDIVDEMAFHDGDLEIGNRRANYERMRQNAVAWETKGDPFGAMGFGKVGV